MNLFEKAMALPKGARVIAEWLGEGGVAVGVQKSQYRADTCLTCPHNRRSGVLTPMVANAIRDHLEVKNKIGLRARGEKKLFQCAVCLCDLKLKIHVPIENIRRHMIENELEAFPEYCWQKNEQP